MKNAWGRIAIVLVAILLTIALIKAVHLFLLEGPELELTKSGVFRIDILVVFLFLVAVVFEEIRKIVGIFLPESDSKEKANNPPTKHFFSALGLLSLSLFILVAIDKLGLSESRASQVELRQGNKLATSSTNTSNESAIRPSQN